jgi:hypothetical protein
MMNWYEVRCCCMPQKVLGWYPLPVHITNFRLPLLARENRLWLGAAPRPNDTFTEVHLQVRDVHVGYPYGQHGQPEIRRAIYSEDQGIEFWRRVRGFVEAPPL